MKPIFQKLHKFWDAMRPQNRTIDRMAIESELQRLSSRSAGDMQHDVKLLAPPVWYHNHAQTKPGQPTALPREKPRAAAQPPIADRIGHEKLRLPTLYHHDALKKLRYGDITARIDTLLALEERIADAPGEVRLITATVAAYILEHTKSDTSRRPGPDVMVGLAVLCRLLNANFPSQTTISLDKANLAGLEMVDADFSRLSLAQVSFAGADLRGANFRGVNLRGAIFRETLLAGACFDNSSIRHAVFDGAVLSDAEFGAAQFAMAGNFDPTQLLATSYAAHLPPVLPPGYSPGIIGLYPAPSSTAAGSAGSTDSLYEV